MLQAKSGGADAAPVAARILEAHQTHQKTRGAKTGASSCAATPCA